VEFSNLILFCNLNSFKLINSIYFIVELAKSSLFGKVYLIRSFDQNLLGIQLICV
jgi:hypothetical protein